MLPIHRPYAALIDSLEPERTALLQHPIYAAVDDPRALATFMETHVFAVWDFMSLLKALQQMLTCVRVPWTPSPSARAARLVNEIVLAEESDLLASGVVTSHFELYVAAMREVGANARPMIDFVRRLEEGQALDAALVSVPLPARRFVARTLATAASGDAVRVASSFLLGREDLVPSMFRRLLPAVERAGRAPSMTLYLERHIEVDEGEHGPMAVRLLEELCGDDPARWSRAREGARDALVARLALWDDVGETIREARASRTPAVVQAT